MPSPLQLGLSWLRAPANELAFLVRSTLRWRRGRPALPNEDKHGMFAHLDATALPTAVARAEELMVRFDLAHLAAHSSRLTFAGNLQHLDGLARLAAAAGGAPPGSADGVVRAVDVGCGDFHYASALAAWLSGPATGPRRAVVLRGIELDGHGIYRDGHSRADHARAHAALASDGGATVQFQVGDFRHLRLPPQDVVTMFFPFVTTHACLRWGGPVSRLAPRRLFHRAVETLAPGGWLVMVNQTAAEFERAATLLSAQALEPIGTVRWTSALVPWCERTTGQIGSAWRRIAG